ncbi:hypothetical protein BH10ACI1_BH10ACI1_32100 [soil metagenome]
MKQNSILIFVFFIVIAFSFRVVSAQFPIKFRNYRKSKNQNKSRRKLLITAEIKLILA